MTFKGRPVTAESIRMMVALWAMLVKKRPISDELRAQAREMGVEL